MKSSLGEKYKRLGLRSLSHHHPRQALHYFKRAIQYDPTTPELYELATTAHKRAAGDKWSESDFSETLSWTMRYQALTNPEVRDTHTLLNEDVTGSSLFKVGLTGDIGSGKSAVLETFKTLGIPTLSADEITHDFLNNSAEIILKITTLFGNEITNKNGSINRKKLATIVFSNRKKRKALEEILHPLVIAEIKNQLAALAISNNRIVVIEIPLLFEVGLETMMDATIVVTAPKSVKIKRLLKKGWRRADVLKRLKEQLPQSTKKTKATYLIDNSGFRQKLSQQVKKLLAVLFI